MLSALESAKAWADIIGGSFTALVIFLGGIIAFWRFVLQRPLGNNWEVTVTPCRLRATPQGWAYVLTVNVQNRSAASQEIKSWWRKMRFPNEVEAEYDPNGHLNVSWRRARCYYKIESLVDGYPLAPGESYSDQLIEYPMDATGEPQQVCYIEYTLAYNEWRWWLVPRRRRERWRWHPIPWRIRSQTSQIMVAPVAREDLVAVSHAPGTT